MVRVPRADTRRTRRTDTSHSNSSNSSVQATTKSQLQLGSLSFVTNRSDIVLRSSGTTINYRHQITHRSRNS